MICSEILTPGNNKTPIIPLENVSYLRNKPPTDSSSTFLRTETRRVKNLGSLKELQSKDKASSPSSIGFEYSRVSTENDNLSKVVSEPTPEEFSKLTNEECIEMGKANKQVFWKNREKYIEH